MSASADTGDCRAARRKEDGSVSTPRRLALPQRLVVLAEHALESPERHPVCGGIREDVQELNLGTGSGLTGNAGVDRPGTAGVRIGAGSRGWRDQSERQHRGGKCCWHSHPGALRSSTWWPTRRPRRRPDIGATSRKEPRATSAIVTSRFRRPSRPNGRDECATPAARRLRGRRRGSDIAGTARPRRP
jgi:hypothetical protein